jgi:hypothetical protein
MPAEQKERVRFTLDLPTQTAKRYIKRIADDDNTSVNHMLLMALLEVKPELRQVMPEVLLEEKRRQARLERIKQEEEKHYAEAESTQT